ncbi:colicin transporter [Sphingobium algorifonticola]|uniref:Colicin transporter n=1 Tax=Sphingobium algorifonticola TaxID=2008318 RepID=A0A437J955_9SPHN|nr:colicin transporter [Sphingobium algorifonticola]RVT42039.1 colicin transporter [Sphingobium algorifonticola]
MIAVKRLQSLFWVLLVTLGALAAYMVSLRAATERNELNRVRSQIAQTRGEIRYLETEFSARASLRQLERWNAEDFRYSTPAAGQYLDGERALARLDGVQPNGPAYVAPPVMTAMVQSPADLPAPVQAAQTSPAATQIRSDIAIIRTAQAADKVPNLPRAATPTAERAKAEAARPGPVARTAERMAMLDSKLLDERTLGDLSARADSEKRKVAR